MNIDTLETCHPVLSGVDMNFRSQIKGDGKHIMIYQMSPSLYRFEHVLSRTLYQ